MPSSTPEFTPNNVWGSAPPEGELHELTLPSGQTCQARKISVTSMVQTGMLAQIDILTATVDKYTRKVKGGKGVPDGSVQVDDAVLKDSETIGNMIQMADYLMPHVVVSPAVVLHFTSQTVGKTVVTKSIPEENRNDMRATQPGIVFTDQIDLNDKMWLFEWAVGGLAAFSTFHREANGDVGGVVAREGSGGKAKRRSRNR